MSAPRSGEPNLWSRVMTVLRHEGALAVASRAAARVIDLRQQVLLECDMTARPAVASLPDVRFAWASLRDLEAHSVFELTATPVARAASVARLTRGDRCLVGTWRGTPATYMWTTTSARELPALDWPLRPGTVFVYKTFTIEDFRGKGLNAAAVAFALDAYWSEGKRTAFVDVDVTNHASLRALRRAGFRDVAYFRTLKLGPRTMTLMSDEVFCRVAGRSRRVGSVGPKIVANRDRESAKEHPCPR
jgi:RimJ/RimL family protein N-acetyltransferase